MNTKEALRAGMDMADVVCQPYVADLSNEELMMRPHPKCNHINWQLGHLIASEHSIINEVAPGSMPALPEGFAEKYTKETASSDDASAFASKDELMKLWSEQREGTKAALEKFSDADLDQATKEEMQAYAPTVGAAFALQGSHWLMHAGQWVIVRRETGREALF